MNTNQTTNTIPGLDALCNGQQDEVLAQLRGRRIGLLTNHTGRTREGVSTLDALRALGCDVRALFSPEHGVEGKREGHIKTEMTADALPIYSLYGATRRPTEEMLREIEVLVCDIQDVGARFYTYVSTLTHCMEECAPRGIDVVVLDRPNPIGGEIIEGPSLDGSTRSFVSYLNIPIRHGMTMGELATLYKNDAQLDSPLHVARVLGWRREMLWPETNLEWLVPSPNLPDYKSAAWYPGLCLLEFSKVSVGRGTEAPFQILGAPWMDAPRVLQALENEPLFAQNFQAEILEFTPTRGEHAEALCRGLKFEVRNSEIGRQHLVPLGLVLLSTLHRVQPEEFNEERLQRSLRLLGSEEVLQLLRAGEIDAAHTIAERDAELFRARREEFLLYD